MKNDYIAQFLVGTSTAITIAIFNLVIAGQINWLWFVIAFIVPFLVLQLYQSNVFSPYKKLYVTNDDAGLQASVGKANGKGAWEFDEGTEKTYAIWGPYKPLGRGKYRADFVLKINKSPGDDTICDIDVCARHGNKRLALRNLTAKDFENIDEYQRFSLDFFVIQDENELEYRMALLGAKCRLTIECVTLSRRLI